MDTNVCDSIIPDNPMGETAQLYTAEDWAWEMSTECGIMQPEEEMNLENAMLSEISDKEEPVLHDAI